MRHYLVQSGGENAVPFMTRLAGRLPEGFPDRAGVELRNLGPASEDSTESRVIASYEPEGEEDLALLKEAVEGLKNDRFSLVADPPLLAPENADPNDISGLKALLPDFPGSDGGRQSNEIYKNLKKIFETEASGKDFPEKSFEGEDLKAYQVICDHFGVAPWEDQANRIRPGLIGNLRKPDDVDQEAWDRVVWHLEDVVLFFTYAQEWLGDTGHLQTINDRQSNIDHAFLKPLADKYLGLKQTQKVNLIFNTMFDLAFTGISKVGGPTATVSSIMRALWEVTSSQLPDPVADTTAKIAEMEQELFQIWLTQMKMLEKQHAKLVDDWGLLEEFGTMVKTKALEWPKVLDDLRRANSTAYHIYAIKQTIHLADVGAELVIKQEIDCGSEIKKAKWLKTFCNPAGSDECFFNWAGKSTKHKRKHWCTAYYLGYKYHDRTSRRDDYLNANRAINRKLFGTNTSSDSDPELAFPARFLTDPKCEERKGWNFPQVTV